ncbi:MAG TPA: DNA primase [Candidatus Avelusimicrobium excrementipullorum]|nr:DNA primase [Candidatus Avelusimicrobium excrementipullorum]
MQENLAEKIKQRIDLVEFVRQYVPHLKKAGKTWKACCPFHKEKTPSFTVSSEKGLYYCFGCQEGGDIFDFLMKMENLSFNEAVRKLADIAGVEYRPQGGFSAAEQQRINARKTLDWAKGFYHKNLMSAGGEFARNYVKGRGLTKETVQKFELGFAKNDAVGLCKAAQANGYTAQQLKDVGLCVQTAYGARDYFRGRLMFPIINQRGETVGFGGRILADGEPKYLNSPETLLFSKSHVLFGLNFAGPAIRKAGRAVLLEGYMDVIACHQAGFENTVAPLGTSLTAEHAKLLKRYTDNAVVLFDPDAAGIKAALRGALVLIEQGLFVKVASLSDGLDPDEYIAKYGKEKFEEVLDSAQDLIAFHTRLQLDLYPRPLDPQAKTAVVSELTETLLKQPDPIVRREWAKYVAEQTGVDEELVLERLRAREQAAARFQQRFNAFRAPSAAPQAEHFNAAEENLVGWLLRFPQYARGCEELAPQFDSRALGELLQALCRAAAENPAPEGFADRVSALAPAQHKLAVRLCMQELPRDFQPQRDIASCKKAVEREALQRQLAAVRQQIKTAGAGQVPAQLLQQMTQLQNKLKN